VLKVELFCCFTGVSTIVCDFFCDRRSIMALVIIDQRDADADVDINIDYSYCRDILTI